MSRSTIYDEQGYKYNTVYIPDEYVEEIFKLAAKKTCRMVGNAIEIKQAARENDLRKMKRLVEEARDFAEAWRTEFRQFIWSIYPWAKDWDGFEFEIEVPRPNIRRIRHF